MMKASTTSYKPVLTKEEEISECHGAAVAEAVPVATWPSKGLVKVLLLTAGFALLVRLFHHCHHDHRVHHHVMQAHHAMSSHDGWMEHEDVGVEPSSGSFDFEEGEGSWSSDSASSDSASSDEDESSGSWSSDESHPHGSHNGPWHWLVGGHHPKHGHDHHGHPHHHPRHHGHPHHPGRHSHDGPGGMLMHGSPPPPTVREGADFIRAPPMMVGGSVRGSMIVRPPGVLPQPPLEVTVSAERRDETVTDPSP